MRGNVCSYELDAPGIADMVLGNLMPRRPSVLASVIQITLFGQRHLPDNWMRNLFRVRRRYIWEALVWLKANNPFYQSVNISSVNLDSLPIDGVPSELMTIARRLDDLDVIRDLNDSYVPDEDDEMGKLCSLRFTSDPYHCAEEGDDDPDTSSDDDSDRGDDDPASCTASLLSLTDLISITLVSSASRGVSYSNIGRD